MTAGSGNASETSPLLPKAPPTPSDASQGALPSATDTNGLIDDPKKTRDEERQQDDEDREAQYQGMPEVRKKLGYILPALAIGIFLSAVDQTIIVSSYGKIGSDFMALNKTSWIATSYFLTLTAFQPLYGKLSDIFGRKTALLVAYTIFGLGCLFCGLARNMNELITARAFAGIGGGGLNTVVSILMSDIVTLRDRGVWQGVMNIIYATGSASGAPLAGVGNAAHPNPLVRFTEESRRAFHIQVPLCILAFISVGLVLKLPKSKTEKSDWKIKLRRVDFLGAFVLVCAIFALIFGLDRGSNVSWSGPMTLVPLCLAVPLFIAFILVELKVAAEPFAPGRIVLERSLIACYLCNFFSFAGWLSAIFFVPLFFQVRDNLTATQAGIRLLPAIIGGVSGSLFGGYVMKRTGKYYWLTVVAYTTLTLGMLPILLCTGLIVVNTYGISIGLAICGFSNGIGVTTSLIGLISNAAPNDQAVATACSYLFRSLGSVVGLSLSATVVQQSLRTQLKERLRSNDDAENIVKNVRESLDYLKQLDPATSEIVRQCYGAATRAGFGLMIGIVFFAALSSWFIREKRLSR